MIKQYIILTWRILLRNKLLSLIKILGLAVGLATFILGTYYVQHEKSYDKHHRNYDRIYRAQVIERDNPNMVGTSMCTPVSNYLNQEIPEVETTVLIRSSSEHLSTTSNNVIWVEDGSYVGKNIFSVFDIPFIYGNQETALDEPNSIILSKPLAEKLFPGENPVGKTLMNESKSELTVTGVFRRLPSNTNLEIEFIRPYEPFFKQFDDRWDVYPVACYVLLKPNIDPDFVNAKIKNVLDPHIRNNKQDVFLHPLSELHLDPNKNGDLKLILYMTSAVILLILILSSLNYMNLSTAYSMTRSKEIGIRKSTGGSGKSLRTQFLFESIFIAFIALFLALFFAKASLGAFNQVVERQLALNYFNTPGLLIIIFSVTALTGFISGVYPALIMSRFKPALVLKGLSPFRNSKGKAFGLKGMVLFQFILSAILIASSVWLYRQVNFLQNKDHGYNQQILLRFDLPNQESINTNYSELRNRILNHPGIESVCVSKTTPLCGSWGRYVHFEGQFENERINARFNPVSTDYIKTFGLKILFGKDFSSDTAANKFTCIVNETAVHQAGWKNDPIGKWVLLDGEKYRVIGVIKDIIVDDIHNEILPYVLIPHDYDMLQANAYTIRMYPNNTEALMTYVRGTFSELFPNAIFEVYAYPDIAEDFALLVWTSIRNTFGLFTIIAILIAGFGLFALVVFSSQKRIKEIGVRKVNGARTYQVYVLIIKEFIYLLAIANLIALPAPIILKNTMPGVNKYTMMPWEYLIIIGISLLVALLSGSYNALKASLMNPVKALRYE